MKPIIFYFLILMSTIACGQVDLKTEVVDASRMSCVKIISNQGNSSGTGFYIGKDIIVTCFHVIAKISVDKNQKIHYNIYQDLQAINEVGDTVALSCISIPTVESPEPIFQDFAILRTKKVFENKSILPLEKKLDLTVSDKILFSGYPLGTPTMITHFGTISGITKDESIICIQASTNKGNSGGALVNKEGKVIGIVSMREGGITKGLQNYLLQISETEKQGSIQLMGIDPLKVTKETISVLDKYISTGIGYSRSIKFTNDYIKKHNIKL